jgi:C4-dicarboxylate-specific signal transduction histidine kinase
MESVIQNLMKNAVDALEGTHDRQGTVEVVLSQDAERVTLTVSDNGPGIPDDALVRIFDPFYTTKDLGKGT